MQEEVTQKTIALVERRNTEREIHNLENEKLRAAKVGQMLLIDCLFYGFCRKNPEATAAARSATAEAIAQKLL